MPETLPFVIIRSRTPEGMIVSLRKFSSARFLWIQQPVGYASWGYVVEMLNYARMGEAMRTLDPSSSPITEASSSAKRVEFSNIHVPWPCDLDDVPGLWKYPLDTTFYNLKVLDLDLRDAVFWLIPILQATHSSAPLRRILLRACDNYMMTVLPLQFEELEEILHRRKAVKLLLAWASTDDEPFIKFFRRRLRNIDKDGRIGVLYERGPKSVIPPPSTEVGKEEDHLGPEYITEEGRVYNDIYAQGIVNEWSWRYNTEQDPFGEL